METNAILPEEIDIFVQSLRKFEVKDVGSKSWLENHERVLKLNQQAIIEASAYREEVVKELLVAHNKLPTLIHEAYCILVWRLKILPKLPDKGDGRLNGFFYLYTILFHEINVISLLEIILFHENSCESLEDTVLDLIDYCIQAITHLIGLMHNGHNEKLVEISKTTKDQEDLEAQKNDIVFNIGMKCITILSYLCDKITVLPVSAARRLTKTHDVPCLLSELLSLRPWMRRIKGFQKYINGKWKNVEGDEILKITKTEAQTWFCLRNLMFHKETFENYEINSFRQRELGKCSGLLNDNLLDQLPPLAELKQFLCTLQLSGNTVNNLNNLILEVIPDIKDNLIENAKKIGWKKIIEDHTKLFMMEENEIVEMAKRLSDAYNVDLMANIEEQQNENNETDVKKFCGLCKKDAIKKCSRCQAIYYCTRECQVKDWINHKTFCYQLVN